MGLYNRFKKSIDAETKGVSFVFETARVTMARAGGGNKSYNKAISAWAAKNKKALELDAIPDETARAYLIELYATDIVLLWETNTETDPEKPAKWEIGIESEDGEILPFTPENVIKTFTALPDFFVTCKKLAEEQQHYRAALAQAIVGN
jgi:hypothetical protein